MFVYNTYYGGIAQLDAGKFFHDVITISETAKHDFGFLIRFILGLQRDTPGSDDYLSVFQNTVNWNNGTLKDYMYNDNRIVIRIHVILNFIAFNSYEVHALFSCFMTFIGINFLFRSFRDWFIGKEFGVMILLCFFPALWFFTGALLKEGITVFIFGNLVFQIKILINGPMRLKSFLWLLFLVFVSALLKPYLLLFSGVFFAAFFLINRIDKIHRKTLFLALTLTALIFILNLFSVALRARSLPDAITSQRQRFIGVSKGGIFLEDAARYIRLSNDTSLIKQVAGRKNFFTMKQQAPYMYWNLPNVSDTLYCASNCDSVTQFELAYIIPESHSNIRLNEKNAATLVAGAMYYSLFYPLFAGISNKLLWIASFENVLLAVSLLTILLGLCFSEKRNYLPLSFTLFAFAVCLLIGLTAPNSGAIFRYRSPAAVFILLAAFYYLPITRKKPERHK